MNIWFVDEILRCGPFFDIENKKLSSFTKQLSANKVLNNNKKDGMFN